jgi:hypothetical protein
VRASRFQWFGAALAIVLAAASVVRGAGTQSAAERRLAAYEAVMPDDAISRLQRRIDAGEVALKFDAKWGYLPSVLAALRIPASSQALVFSKTSFQLDKIGPWSPRAIYFGDDTYIGWVQRGTVLEVATVDPARGAMFYTLAQQPAAAPRFERQTHNCLQCHDSSLNTGGVPGFVVQSLYVDRYGYPLSSRRNPVMSDRAPFNERFGGWYVTGTHGDQVHMGNLAAELPAGDIGNMGVYIDRLDLHAGANVTDLSARIKTSAYLSPGSDIVAQMLLIHQTSVHNLITQASLDAGGPNEAASAEAMLRGLLFAGEAPLEAPIHGSAEFAAAFTGSGPRDSHGRSLRDLDLTHRLLKYPLSYLIYSEGFDGLPASVKSYVSRRLAEILTGKDNSPEFAPIDSATRQAILEILQDTKPSLLGK